MKAQKFEKLLHEVNSYYTDKIEAHGAVARGVDWNGEASQELRYRELLRIAEGRETFSINDVGCGYGFLCEYLVKQTARFQYTGADISEAMLTKARERYGKDPRVKFVDNTDKLPAADFSVASGVFSVKLQQSEELWKEYIESVLEKMDRVSTTGFAFNMMTSYSDPEKMRKDLFYANPAEYFDLCKRRFSKQVALLHDYGLYEFTILVRKQP